MGILEQLSYGIHYHIQETKYCSKAKENNTMRKTSLCQIPQISHRCATQNLAGAICPGKSITSTS